MTGKQAYEKASQLQRDLMISLETFDRKDNIRRLREKLIQVQKECPHYDMELNWTYADNHCPYCGREMQ